MNNRWNQPHFSSLCFIFYYFLFLYFLYLGWKLRKCPSFYLKKITIISKTSYLAVSVYILNNIPVLLSALLVLFLSIHHNHVLKSINCTLKSVHYVETSNIYFAGLLFVFCAFVFCAFVFFSFSLRLKWKKNLVYNLILREMRSDEMSWKEKNPEIKQNYFTTHIK